MKPPATEPHATPLNPARARACPRHWLARTLVELTPRRVLVITASPGVFDDLAVPSGTRAWFVHAESGERPASVEADLAALPFQSEVFDLVVLHDLVRDGDERLIGEGRRILKGGAHLLVIGMGRYGAERLADPRDGKAAIRPFRLCRRLRQRSFVVEACHGFGVARLRVATGVGWRRLLVPASDRLCVLARFSQVRPVIRRVRFPRPQAAGVRARAMEGAFEHTSGHAHLESSG